MKVDAVETIVCDAGWRNYYFLKLSTDNGIVGWSEYDEGFGSPGVTAVIEQLKHRLIGQDVNAHERFVQLANSLTRPAPGSVIGQAIGCLENALLDAKAKALGVPCYELLGGKVRDKARVYWSHCPTWRINHPKFYGPAVKDLDGVRATAAEARERGFTALKTNLFIHDEDEPYAWRAGFAIPFLPELTVDKRLIRNIRTHLEALREGAGPDMGLLIDFNFNAKPEGLIRVLKELADLDLFWVEIDMANPRSLADVRRHSPHPISSCETLIGMRSFLPYFEHQAMDVAIIDAVWNGVWQATKIAALAEAHEINVAPHNFYGDLCTMMNAHFAAVVPNLHIMEADIDRLPWESELYTHSPEYKAGFLIIPDRPGWGTEPIEEALRARPPKVTGGLLQYKRS
ncbi:mandelate racemase/muconate lactonizing enzyme family protein [Cupriavidus consociatus]|uniref:mandelate racemase/muconate lactonizing enzyme family protein n=1 Tax=Cupriavidus consociatus TaxID=2821357 RepID=UPI001AE5CBA6|nr:MULTISPECIES: mandelate racemase/muconate lactonizing enzyme family protein [unclassified Cupriavidus]MBP0623361.1 mandelate racemase/muconate lactonizing enzyme family protein [Cupriavidus sp. LEh25]MDK2660058.1 mandelate racemase/muconate lactonizing enzyme family protein [Cupriavidus sp. LEh21]